MKRFILGLMLALVAGLAYGQTAPTCVTGAKGVAPTATMSFVPPTVNTDGTAIAAPLTYNIYQGTATGAEVKVASGAKGTPIVVNTGVVANTTYYWKISVVDASGNESALSNETCKLFPASVPGAVTITIT